MNPVFLLLHDIYSNIYGLIIIFTMEGGGGLFDGGLIKFFTMERGGLLEGGGLFEDLGYLKNRVHHF